jgi:hypothetical protein
MSMLSAEKRMIRGFRHRTIASLHLSRFAPVVRGRCHFPSPNALGGAANSSVVVLEDLI